MALPGKLTISFLHEDNPLKSFFRMKPLLTQEAGGLEPSNIDERFPDEGFIRIVPDKNEILLFKNRMRQLGRYCCLDLRKHLGENDKIRPNKNYYSGAAETNQHIVYSDVVCRAPAHLAVELIDLTEEPHGDEAELDMVAPGTHYVLTHYGDTICGPWTWCAVGVASRIRLNKAADQTFSSHPAQSLLDKVLELTLDDGTNVRLLYDLEPFALVQIELPEPEVPLGYEPAHPAMPPFPPEGYHAPDMGASGEPGAKSMEAPWLMRTESLRPRAVSANLSLREQALQAQVGINPRRGRSLHEVVDEQWRKSRYDQLGHPVPTQAQGRPTLSPIERAVHAVNEAWALSEAQTGLTAELLKNEELKEALLAKLSLPALSPTQAGTLNVQLNELEASRLKVIGEIDALRLKRETTKAQLMDEMRLTYRQEFSEYERRIAALKAEAERHEQLALASTKSSELSQKLLNESQDKFDERLMGSLMGQRLLELSGHERKKAGAGRLVTYEPNTGELLSDMRIQMERAGFPMSNDEAVNLLCCMMSGGMLILSGGSGSGKSDLARRLGDVLGLRGQAERFVEARTPSDACVRALLQKNDGIAPLMVLLDDFNTGDEAGRALKIIELQESAAAQGTPLVLILTAQDAPEGHPISARMLGRSFLIRLPDATPDAPWRPAALKLPEPERTVSLLALSRIFSKETELPGETSVRLDKLRAGLAKHNWTLDRRTLNELWYYCAAAQPLMQCSPLELLDWALAQRVLPAMLASMELEALHELPNLLVDMPRCLDLMKQPLPLPPL